MSHYNPNTYANAQPFYQPQQYDQQPYESYQQPQFAKYPGAEVFNSTNYPANYPYNDYYGYEPAAYYKENDLQTDNLKPQKENLSTSTDYVSTKGADIDAISQDTANETPSRKSKKKSNIAMSHQTIMQNWGPEDDNKLVRYVIKFKNDWKKIAKTLSEEKNVKITPHFLKSYYKKELGNMAGGPNKRAFNKKDDLTIVMLINKFGLDWEKLSSIIKDRNPMNIKNRYYSHIRKNSLFNDLLAEAQKTDLNLDLPDSEEDIPEKFVVHNEEEIEEMQNNNSKEESESGQTNGSCNRIFDPKAESPLRLIPGNTHSNKIINFMDADEINLPGSWNWNFDNDFDEEELQQKIL